MKIAAVNLKGGTGKSTSIMLLAMTFEKSGASVGLIDRDVKQKTLTKWLDNYQSDLIEYAQEGKEYDFVLIDTPPRIESNELEQSLSDAEKIFLISSASPFDSWSSQDFVSIMGKKIKGNAHLLFNKVNNRAILDRDLSGIADKIGLPYLKSNISDRKVYQNAILLGWQALPANAREELLILANEITRL